MPDQDLIPIADLLVRCSGVPLSRVAQVLGFSDEEEFAPWFERHHGRSPEMARVLWTMPAANDPDTTHGASLRYIRRVLASAAEPRDLNHLLHCLRSRRPIEIPSFETSEP